MSHVFELTDEQYEVIKEARYRQAHPTYYETDEWLRHLGVSEKEIEASKERVRQEHEMPYDTDAS